MISSLLSSDASPPASSVKSVTAATFKAEVFDASRDALVLVHFGTPRDPSCGQQVDILSKLARDSKGAFLVVRVDIDRDQTVAAQLGLRSVPAVYAFYQGRPIDAFSGALSEEQIKSWCDGLLKTTGVGGPEKAGLDTAFQQAEDFLSEGNAAMADAIYADILDMDPENPKAYAGAIKCLLAQGKAAEAQILLEAASPAVAKDRALDSVRAALELVTQTASAQGRVDTLKAALEKNKEDHQARFDLALAYYAENKREEAVDQLLEIVRRARAWNDEAARKQLVKFFEAFGPSDPLTLSARRRLSSILFS